MWHLGGAEGTTVCLCCRTHGHGQSQPRTGQRRENGRVQRYEANMCTERRGDHRLQEMPSTLRAGEMLVPDWEAYATAVANANTDQELFDALQHVIENENITASANATVLIGGDTRPHTEALVHAACQGVELSGARVVNIGTCTTPVLHYSVLQHNQPSLAPYGQRLVEAFKCLTSGALLPCQTGSLLAPPEHLCFVSHRFHHHLLNK